jgi:hypothetical protein
MTIEYKYCCNTLDLTKSTFEEALKLDHYTKDECWINTPLRLLQGQPTFA